MMHKCILLLFTIVSLNQLAIGETLDEVVDQAVKNNQLISAVKVDTQAAGEQLLATQGLRYPQVNISTAYNQLDQAPSIYSNIGGKTIQKPTAQAGGFKSQVMISLPVFTSGRLTHEIGAAEASKNAAVQHEKTTLLDIKLQVGYAYIGVLRAEKSVKVALSHVASLTEHSKDVYNLYQQEMTPRNDLLASQVKLSNAEQALLQKENQLSMSKIRINQLLNRQLTANVSLEPVFLAPPDEPLAKLIAQALAQRSELTMLDEQIKSLKHRASSEASTLLPQVNINSGYQYEENKYSVTEDSWVANVTMKWRLGDGSTKHRSQSFKKQRISLKFKRNDLVSQIELQVHQAWLDIRETRQRAEVAKQAIDQSNENLKVSTDRYREGLATNTEVIDAEDLRTQTKNNLNNAEYDLAVSTLNLRRALGTL